MEMGNTRPVVRETSRVAPSAGDTSTITSTTAAKSSSDNKPFSRPNAIPPSSILSNPLPIPNLGAAAAAIGNTPSSSPRNPPAVSFPANEKSSSTQHTNTLSLRKTFSTPTPTPAVSQTTQVNTQQQNANSQFSLQKFATSPVQTDISSSISPGAAATTSIMMGKHGSWSGSPSSSSGASAIPSFLNTIEKYIEQPFNTVSANNVTTSNSIPRVNMSARTSNNIPRSGSNSGPNSPNSTSPNTTMPKPGSRTDTLSPLSNTSQRAIRLPNNTTAVKSQQFLEHTTNQSTTGSGNFILPPEFHAEGEIEFLGTAGRSASANSRRKSTATNPNILIATPPPVLELISGGSTPAMAVSSNRNGLGSQKSSFENGTGMNTNSTFPRRKSSMNGGIKEIQNLPPQPQHASKPRGHSAHTMIIHRDSSIIRNIGKNLSGDTYEQDKEQNDQQQIQSHETEEKQLAYNPHRPLLPSQTTYPQFKNATPGLQKMLQQGEQDPSVLSKLLPVSGPVTAVVNSEPTMIPVLETSSAKTLERLQTIFVMPLQNLVHSLSLTVSNARRKANNTGMTNSPSMINELSLVQPIVLSPQYANVLLLILARAGDINTLKRIVGSASNSLDMNMVDDEGRTALIYASIGGHVACVRYLVEKGALVSMADYSGRTALHWASHYGKTETVATLLKLGAKPLDTDSQGKTALHCATYAEREDTLRVLVKRLADKKKYPEFMLDIADGEKMTPLMWAAYYGHMRHMKMLLKRNVNPRLIDMDGKATIHWTISNKHTQCLQLLINISKDMVSLTDNQGRLPLHLSSAEGNIAITDYLLRFRPTPEQVNQPDKSNRTPLHWSCVKGSMNCSKLLLDAGASPNAADEFGATPLHYASQQNHLDVLHLLLRKNASVNVSDSAGRTPLVWAAVEGHLDIVKLLLASGADVGCRDKNGLSALHAAAHYGKLGCSLLLIRQGAKVNAVDNKNQTPLFRAVIMGYADLVVALLNEGALVNAQDMDGRMPLHWAANAGRVEIAHILVNYGSPIDGMDNTGATPLHEAAYKGNTDTITFLIEHGANTNATDDSGITPLHFAAANGFLASCELLINFGANMNAMEWNADRDTPLDYAILGNHVEVVKFLKSKESVKGSEMVGESESESEPKIIVNK